MCMANGPYRSRCNFVGTPRVVEGCTTDRLEAHRFIFGAHVRASVLLVASSSPSHYSCTTPAEGERTSQQHEAPKKPTRPSRRSSQRPIKASGQCRARRPTRFVAWQERGPRRTPRLPVMTDIPRQGSPRAGLAVSPNRPSSLSRPHWPYSTHGSGYHLVRYGYPPPSSSSSSVSGSSSVAAGALPGWDPRASGGSGVGTPTPAGIVRRPSASPAAQEDNTRHWSFTVRRTS